MTAMLDVSASAKTLFGNLLSNLETVNLNPPVYRPPSLPLGISGILLSWALGILLEVIFWKLLVARRIGNPSFLFTLGALALIQIVSTPLSFAVCFATHGMVMGGTIQNDYFNKLFLFLDITRNPVGVIVGFLLLPVIVELVMWQYLVKHVRYTQSNAGTPLPNPPTFLRVLSTSLLANAFSFTIGLVLSFGLTSRDFLLDYYSSFGFLSIGGVEFLPSVLVLILVPQLAGFVVWFLFKSRLPDSHQSAEESEQSADRLEMGGGE